MENDFNFLQARMNEIIYQVPEATKLTISTNKINQHQGDNKVVNTLILYQTVSGNELNDTFRETLHKIIASLNLPFNEVETINANEINNLHFQVISKFYSFKNLICLGLNPSDLGLRFEGSFYQPIELHNCTMIFSDPVEKLNTTTKVKLWKAIQQMYQFK